MTSSNPCRFGTSTAVVALLFGTVACGTLGDAPAPPHAQGALALVIGHRSNFPRPQVVGEHAQRVIEDSVRSQDTLTVVGVSGDPRPLYTLPMTGACDSPASCTARVQDYSGRISQLLGKVKASAPEANTLEAIAVAARSVAGSSGPKHIVVIDNGLQTIGAMPLQSPGALSADADVVVQTLADAGRLEKLLAGTEITLVGLGDGHDPQKSLSQHKRDQLKVLWEKVLRKAGAASVFVEPTELPDKAPQAGLPPVTVVPAEDDPPPPIEPCTKVREDQVGFLPNRADFRDPTHARSVLEPLAKKILSERLTATLKGTTALPETPGSGSLSDRRARAVKDVLGSLGVPAGSLQTDGVGTNFTGYVDPQAPDGVFKEPVAVQDRLVLIELPGARC